MAKIVYLLIATLSTGMANPEQTKAREAKALGAPWADSLQEDSCGAGMTNRFASLPKSSLGSATLRKSRYMAGPS